MKMLGVGHVAKYRRAHLSWDREDNEHDSISPCWFKIILGSLFLVTGGSPGCPRPTQCHRGPKGVRGCQALLSLNRSQQPLSCFNPKLCENVRIGSAKLEAKKLAKFTSKNHKSSWQLLQTQTCPRFLLT